MRRFKSFIREMAEVSIANLNPDFLKRAQKVTSFNLRGSDFESLKYKAEIQYLFRTFFFPKFNLDETLKGDIKLNQVNKLIQKLKSESMVNYNKLHFYNLKGVGPGEATLYFLLDDAQLGGGTSAGVDLLVAGKKSEVKAALYSKNERTLSGFKLGGTAPVGKLVTELVDMKERLGFQTKGKGQAEVNTSQLNAIRKEFPSEMKKIEAEYGKIAGRYFGNIPVIFVNNNSSNKIDPEDTAEKSRQLTGDAGGIVAIKKITPKDILMHVVTQGTIKPKIKL